MPTGNWNNVRVDGPKKKRKEKRKKVRKVLLLSDVKSKHIFHTQREGRKRNKKKNLPDPRVTS